MPTITAREAYIPPAATSSGNAAQRPGRQAADDVGEPDQRQRQGRHAGRQAAQVHRAGRVGDEEGDGKPQVKKPAMRGTSSCGRGRRRAAVR